MLPTFKKRNGWKIIYMLSSQLLQLAWLSYLGIWRTEPLFSFCQCNTNHEYHPNISITMQPFLIILSGIYLVAWQSLHNNVELISTFSTWKPFIFWNPFLQQSEFKFQVRIQANQKRFLFLWMYFKLNGHIHIWIWIYCFYTYCKHKKSFSQTWYDRVVTAAGTWVQ